MSTVQEIQTEKSKCPWFAIQDREDRDLYNQVFWKKTQIQDMRRLLASFCRVYGEDNVVLNVQQKFFTFKVFQPSIGQEDEKKRLKETIMEFSKSPYKFKFNPRNEALYNVYPK